MNQTLAENMTSIFGALVIATLLLVTLAAVQQFAQRRVYTSTYIATTATAVAVAETETLTRTKTRTAVRERITEETDKDPGSLVFFHGTSTGAFKDFRSGAVDFTTGDGTLGKGFYTAGGPAGLAEAAAYAYEKEAIEGGTAIIVMFVMKSSDFATLRGLGPLPPGGVPACYWRD